MEKTISILRESVFRQVSRRMEWTGTRSPEDNDYGRLALSETDKNLFHPFFDEAAMHAVDICRPFLKSVSNTDESLTMTLGMNEEAGLESPAPVVESMITQHVLALWQEIVSPGRAAGAYAKRDDYAWKLQGILYHRQAPSRSLSSENNSEI